MWQLVHNDTTKSVIVYKQLHGTAAPKSFLLHLCGSHTAMEQGQHCSLLCWMAGPAPVGVCVAHTLQLHLPAQLLTGLQASGQLWSRLVVQVVQHTLAGTNRLQGLDVTRAGGALSCWQYGTKKAWNPPLTLAESAWGACNTLLADDMNHVSWRKQRVTACPQLLWPLNTKVSDQNSCVASCDLLLTPTD
jgi:hypothetical protein